jgi:hypothetical protein
MRKGPVEHGVGHARHILGAGEQDGGFNHTHFPYLLGVSDFTKPIEPVNTGDDFLLEEIARVRHNGRHPGAHRADTRHEFSLTLDQGRVPYSNSRHIGDGIEWAS